MKTKQLFSTILALLMLLTVLPFSAFAAGEKVVTFTSSKTEVEPGASFTITVMMPEVDCPVGFGGQLQYDNTQLECVEVKEGDYVPAAKDWNYLSDEGTYISFSITTLDVGDHTKPLFTVTFKVKDDATGTITLTPEFPNGADDFFNSDDYENIAYTVDCDTVTVKGAVETFKVTFDADGGTPVPTAQTVESGKTATEPTAPTKEGYDFDGWYNGETKYVFSTAVSADLTLKAKWTAKTYTITWKNDDGTTIDTTTVAYGETPTHADATKADTDKYTYTFKGWTPAIEKVTGAATYTAEFTETEKAHTHSTTKVEAKAATCEKEGNIEYYECSCGQLFSDAAATTSITKADTVLAALGHDWDEGTITKDPTCEAEGVKTYTCKNDSTHTKTEAIEALGHDWDEGTVTTEPTCEAEGEKTFTCKNDSTHTKTEKVAALGHKWDEGTVTTEPTCEAEGEKTFTCQNDSTHTKTEKVAALGHDWGDWTVTKEATESEEGEETRTCARCGETETRPIEKISNSDFAEALARSLRNAAMTLRQRAAVEEAAKKAAEEAAKKAAEEAAKNALPFTDVAKDSPAYDDIKYVYDNGIMIGMSDTTFGEDIPLTRGMIVTVLWRMEGKPEVAYTGVFTDVPAGEWYTDGVEWAASKGIVLGYGDDTFGPQNNVTREQLAAILFRYAQYKGYDVSVGEDTNILSYYDAFTWGQWAVPALQWACGADVIEDSPVGMLRPTEDATRGEIAHAIHVFLEEVAK